MSTLVFQVIDTTCESTNQSFFPPRVSLVTRSHTTIATVRGYSEYIPSTPPKKYKTLTWSGTSEQIATASADGSKASDAKYEYAGFGQINSQGQQVSNYAKNLFTPCPDSNFYPLVTSVPNFGLSDLKGYCWTTDPRSCPICQYPPLFKRDEAINSTVDEPFGFIGVGPGFRVVTPTSLTNIGIQSVEILISGVVGVPQSTFNGFTGAWLSLTVNNDYAAVLTDEYTDAEALTNALIINSNGSTAETFSRTTGFVSRWTTVSFDVLFSNLVVDQDYVGSVDLWNSSGTHTTVNYAFTAASNTHIVTDAVPVPAQGHTITVRKPTVAFAP